MLCGELHLGELYRDFLADKARVQKRLGSEELSRCQTEGDTVLGREIFSASARPAGLFGRFGSFD